MRVLALHCHPDDIEFMMAGTLFLLRRRGCELHYMHMASGSCGSESIGPERLVRIRAEEARSAAEHLGAEYHGSLCDDIEVFYTSELIRKTTAVIREVAPDILLLPSPEDYMEDHMNTCRIGVTAAFCRGMPNYVSIPDVPPIAQDVTLYHALPHGLRDGMRRLIRPEYYVDIAGSVDEKEQMLAAHRSQKEWLDASQGMDSYLVAMREMSEAVGSMSGRFRYAEGWRRHAHVGFSAQEQDPLRELLSDHICPGTPPT
jgi:LmbE family N-acetylglucosaminyl deacetylase